MELKFDRDGIGYIDISNNSFPLYRKQFIDLDYYSKEPIVLKRDFYLLPSSNNYILKVNKVIDYNDVDNYLMLKELIMLQSKINDIEFPIGYVKYNSKIVGQIIRNYNAPSLKNICISSDLSSLQKYIYLDDDSLHNLFLVYLEILEKLEKLFSNNVSYLDCHAGNWIIANNDVKLIDFDSNLVSFSKNSFYETLMLRNYIRMINRVSHEFLLPSSIVFDNQYHFSNVKKKVIDFENRIRRIEK